MKGYIVGYVDCWANDIMPYIRGYFTNWNKALNVLKDIQRENLSHHDGMWKAHLVEIEVNTVYPDPVSVNWFEAYKYYSVQQTSEDTFELVGNLGKTISLNLFDQENTPEEQIDDRNIDNRRSKRLGRKSNEQRSDKRNDGKKGEWQRKKRF